MLNFAPYLLNLYNFSFEVYATDICAAKQAFFGQVPCLITPRIARLAAQSALGAGRVCKADHGSQLCNSHFLRVAIGKAGLHCTCSERPLGPHCCRSGASQHAVLPRVPYLDTLRWVFIALALGGIAIAVWARLEDWRKGRR